VPILISDKRIDKAIERLVKKQPSRTSKQGLATAILDRAARMCQSDPQAWESIGSVRRSSDGTADSNMSGSVRPDNP
jgi:hypothetical protein